MSERDGASASARRRRGRRRRCGPRRDPRVAQGRLTTASAPSVGSAFDGDRQIEVGDPGNHDHPDEDDAKALRRMVDLAAVTGTVGTRRTVPRPLPVPGRCRESHRPPISPNKEDAAERRWTEDCIQIQEEASKIGRRVMGLLLRRRRPLLALAAGVAVAGAAHHAGERTTPSRTNTTCRRRGRTSPRRPPRRVLHARCRRKRVPTRLPSSGLLSCTPSGRADRQRVRSPEGATAGLMGSTRSCADENHPIGGMHSPTPVIQAGFSSSARFTAAMTAGPGRVRPSRRGGVLHGIQATDKA